MKQVTHGSLFSGIGGFDLAAEWMGWENVFHCEKEKFCQRVLNYYWPNAILHDDIKTTDFEIYRGSIDVLSGGFPCQPYSQSGERRGTEDERHLWPEMLRAIREISPRWVVGENVRGLTNWNGGVVFDEVQSDLENEGYKVTPFLLPAAGINAPHERYRIWFVAHAEGKRSIQRSHEIDGQGNSTRCSEGESERRGEDAANASGLGLEGWGNDGLREQSEQPEFKGSCSALFIADSNGDRQPAKKYREKKPGRTSEKSLPNHWENWPTQSPVFGGDDGIPAGLDGITFSKWRHETLKAYGNAIVPQLAIQIFKAIEQYELTP